MASWPWRPRSGPECPLQPARNSRPLPSTIRLQPTPASPLTRIRRHKDSLLNQTRAVSGPIASDPCPRPTQGRISPRSGRVAATSASRQPACPGFRGHDLPLGAGLLEYVAATIGWQPGTDTRFTSLASCRSLCSETAVTIAHATEVDSQVGSSMPAGQPPLAESAGRRRSRWRAHACSRLPSRRRSLRAGTTLPFAALMSLRYTTRWDELPEAH